MNNNEIMLERKLLVISNYTMNVFLQQENPADLIALYMFYYYIAKWQETNQPKATIRYAAKGLRWKLSKVRKVKKQLIELNLIEDITQRNEKNKITGWYIRIKYLWKEDETSTLPPNPEGGKNASFETANLQQTCSKDADNLQENQGLTPHAQKISDEIPPCPQIHSVDFGTTNALSVNNINAFNNNNKNNITQFDRQTAFYLEPDSFSLANTKKRKRKPADPRIKEIIDWYFQLVQEKKNIRLVIDGADAVAVERALKHLSENEIKKALTFYLDSKKAQEMGYSMNIALSKHSLNAWKVQYEKERWKYEG